MAYLSKKEEEKTCRLSLLNRSKRIVVKVGSAVLVSGSTMNLEVIDSLAQQISDLKKNGREVVLVSSGAVAAGRQKFNYYPNGDISLQEKQAMAAIGQSYLMHIYDEAFLRHSQAIAQILLTHDDLADRNRYLNFKNTLNTLLKLGVTPIINENDSVATEELQFGDNDNLAALVTNLIEADLLICLTDVYGLFTADPERVKNAKPVHTVTEVTAEIEAMAGNSKSALGTGGMQSKISAAKKVASGGGGSFIGYGKNPKILSLLFKGDMVGTFFLPRRKRLQGRKQWIAYVLKPQGKIWLDGGAVKAICNLGKSLLPSGVTKVTGKFISGEAIQCIDNDGKIIGVGLASYGAKDIQRILGAKSELIDEILGYKQSDEIIHRDNLVIL